MNADAGPTGDPGAHAALLVRLDDAIRPLADAAEATWIAARLLGEHLAVDRCAYADVEADEDTFNLSGDYTRGVPSIVGRYRFAQFGQACLALMRADQPYLVEDAETDPRTEDVRESYRATLIRAVICVPLHRGGRFVAAMAVHQTYPRAWTPAEVGLTLRVANRCWESIERIRIARELRASEERLQAALGAARQVAWEYDPAGDHATWSSTVTEVLGLRPGDALTTADDWNRWVHPDDQASHRAVIDEAMRTGGFYRSEFRWLRPDGAGTVWIETSGRVQLRADGRPARLAGLLADVSARKRVEQRDAFLVALDDALRPLTDPDEITATAMRRLVVHLGADRCALALFAADEDALVMTAFEASPDIPSVVAHRSLRDFGDEAVRHLRANQPLVVDDVEHIDAIGTAVEIYRGIGIRAHISTPLHKDGRLAAALGVHQRSPRTWRPDEVDLVRRVADRCWESIERARAQTDLRRQWHTFDVALSHSPDYTYIFDLAGRFTYANRGLLALWQKTLAEVVGRDFVELGYPIELAERLQDQIQQVIRTRALVRDQTPFVTISGETRYYEYIFVPVVGADERVQGVAGSTRDITEHIRITQDLRRANDQLSRTNRELEQYAYVASHDLQEPLRMVSQYVSLLDLRARSRLDDATRGYLDRALAGALRMQTMIRDLLSFAQVDRDGPLVPVDLGAAFTIASEHLRPRITEAGATVVAEPLPTVAGHELQLVQVLQNLIGNALKFRSPERTPVVRVTARQRDDGWWEIAVSDDGIGIPAEHRERIFDLFQRLHGRADYEGTGIGLAVCKKIVEHHGGEIRIADHAGPGATFSFTLPPAPIPGQKPGSGADQRPTG